MKIFRSVIGMGFIFIALWTFASLEKVKADNTKNFCSGEAGGKIPICENGNTDDCCPPGPYLDTCTCMYCEHPVAYNYMLCTCAPRSGTTWCYANKIYNWQWEQGYECYGENVITNNKGILYCGATQAAEAGQLPNCDPPTTCSLITSMTKKPPPSNKNSKNAEVK